MLSIAGSAIDFAIVHWYPSGSGAADRADRTGAAPGELAQLRQEITQYAGPDSPGIGVALTEMNGGVDEDTQPDALFGADAYFTALENGVFTVDWWDTHNGADRRSARRPTARPTTATGACCPAARAVGRHVCEPALNTPFPTYYAISHAEQASAGPATRWSAPAPTSELVAAHAVRHANGDLAVMLVNKDPDNAYPVQPALRRLHPERRDADRLHLRRRGDVDHDGGARARAPARRCRPTRSRPSC